jgi:predicted component of type VI protein secretion system
MKAELVPENGDPPIPITRDVAVVGRREFCDVTIDDPSVSKRHCVLVKTDGLLVIRDLATTNGTKVKGQRIRWAALLPDDRITLGAYKMRVYLGPDDAPGPSELARCFDLDGKAAPVTPPPSSKAKEVLQFPSSEWEESEESIAPSSLDTRAVAPGEFWATAVVEPQDQDDDESRWQDLLLPRADPDDDVPIELD